MEPSLAANIACSVIEQGVCWVNISVRTPPKFLAGDALNRRLVQVGPSHMYQ